VSADFSPWAPDPDVLIRWVFSPQAGVLVVMVPMGPERWGPASEEWVIHLNYPVDDPRAQSDAQVEADARQALGIPDLPMKIHKITRWSVEAVMASAFRVGRVLLLGDAAHTTHFTIGSGTRLAIEDAIALAQALGESAPRSEILTRYEMSRKNALRQLQTDAKFSARWFEDVSRYITLPPEAMFALMQARRSPLIPSLPPMLYYRLHQFSEALAPLRAVRTLIGQGTRLRHNRRPAQ